MVLVPRADGGDETAGVRKAVDHRRFGVRPE
jgi:hypothetical protein